MVLLTDSDDGPDIYSASYMYFYPIITFPGPPPSISGPEMDLKFTIFVKNGGSRSITLIKSNLGPIVVPMFPLPLV